MPVKSANSEAVRAAVQRILDGDPLRAPNCDLLDVNLVLEAGVSRATLYRCEEPMITWRLAKEAAAAEAIKALGARKVEDPSLDLTDELLWNTARIDYAAFHKMPEEIQLAWVDMKTAVPWRSRREHVGYNADQVIETLVNQLFGATLALRRAHETIEALTEQVNKLGGNIVPIRPTQGGPETSG